MTRVILSMMLTGLMIVLVGCHGADSGKSQLLPSRLKVVSVVEASEADIVEQMSINRMAYRQYTEALIKHYKDVGNNMKLGWAKSELKMLNKIPQYNYIIEASVPGPELRAVNSIAEAELMYLRALQTEKKAKQLVVITDDDLLREALDQYNQLIRRYPTSDRIDDAAFKAAKIYEYFKDYTIALMYYQRAYQWDPEESYPAKLKAARILDNKLHRRSEALELYKQVVGVPGLSKSTKQVIQTRINELTRGEQDKK